MLDLTMKRVKETGASPLAAACGLLREVSTRSTAWKYGESCSWRMNFAIVSLSSARPVTVAWPLLSPKSISHRLSGVAALRSSSTRDGPTRLRLRSWMMRSLVLTSRLRRSSSCTSLTCVL
jgi:hypothetical protein